MRFGAVFRYSKSYGAVRCCNVFYRAVRCGFENRNPTVRFGAALKNRKSYGVVRLGFQKSGILRCSSLWFSDTVNPTVRFVAVFTNQKSYGAIRHRSPFNGFSTVRFQQQHRFLSTVHRMNKPYKIAVSYGSHAFSRGSNETDVPLLFLYGAPYC